MSDINCHGEKVDLARESEQRPLAFKLDALLIELTGRILLETMKYILV